jgi:hypothetical protein
MPAMSILGLGAGIALNPMLLVAMSDVEESESGLASGIVNTSFMMGGGLGLAVLASLASARTHALTESGRPSLSALLSGYHLAFAAGAVFAAGAGVIGGLLLRDGKPVEEAGIRGSSRGVTTRRPRDTATACEAHALDQRGGRRKPPPFGGEGFRRRDGRDGDLQPASEPGASHPSPHRILACAVSSPHRARVRLVACQANLQCVPGALHPSRIRAAGQTRDLRRDRPAL